MVTKSCFLPLSVTGQDCRKGKSGRVSRWSVNRDHIYFVAEFQFFECQQFVEMTLKSTNHQVIAPGGSDPFRFLSKIYRISQVLSECQVLRWHFTSSPNSYVLLSLFYKWGNWGMERSRNLSKVTQLPSGEIGIETLSLNRDLSCGLVQWVLSFEAQEASGATRWWWRGGCNTPHLCNGLCAHPWLPMKKLKLRRGNICPAHNRHPRT